MIAHKNKRLALAEINNNFTPLRNEVKEPQTPINLLQVDELKTPQRPFEINSANNETINHLRQLLAELITTLDSIQSEKKTLKSVQTQTIFCKASINSKKKVSIKKASAERPNKIIQKMNEENGTLNQKNPINAELYTNKQVLFNGSPRKIRNCIPEFNIDDNDKFEEDHFEFSNTIDEFSLNLQILEAKIEKMYGSNLDLSSS